MRKYFFTVICALVVGISSLSFAEAHETIIVAISLNEEQKGEYIIKATDDRDYLLKIDDLTAMGLSDPKGTPHDIEGNRYLSLKSMKGVTFSYDQEKLALVINAAPDLFMKRTIDFAIPKKSDVYDAKSTSAFLNYGLAYSAGNAFTESSGTAANQLGVRVSDFLFLSDSTYTIGNGVNKFVRLMSNITYDDRARMERLIMGDLYASSGILGSTVNMCGLSYAKNYAINPYFIKQPMFDYSGYAKVPSEVSVALDGVQMRSERLSPGPFHLKDILSYTGGHNLQITVKDMFGREQVLMYPLYFTDLLLGKGLHEYSYNIGFLREGFGSTSNRYGDPVFLAFHRYGLDDAVTTGFRAEASRRLYSIGYMVTYRLSNYGVTNTALSYSSGNGENGLAAALSYNYTGKIFNLRLQGNAYTKKYSAVINQDPDNTTRFDIAAGIGCGSARLGSLSLDLSSIKRYLGKNQSAASLSYSRNLSKNSAINLSFRHVVANRPDNQLSVGITYYPWKDITVSTYYQGDRSSQTATLQVQKNPPVNEGFSYRVSLEGKESSTGALTQTGSPYVQYNGRYGIYSAEYRGSRDATEGTDQRYQLSASGGIVYVGDSIAFSRSINDSFALIKVGNLPGVGAYYNNQEIGKTNSAGQIVIPNLASYVENYITIDDKDIPVNYALESVTRVVSPPLKSGTLIKFEALKTQAFTGKLMIKTHGETKPIEFHEIKMTAAGKEFIFMTGRGGEFYFENVPYGAYEARLEHLERKYSVKLVIPKSDNIMVMLGEIFIEDKP